MKTEIIFQPATMSDSARGADLILLTLREFGDIVFGFGSHERAERAMRDLFTLPRNRFSYQHATLAFLERDVVGLLALFDARSLRRAWWATIPHLFRVFSLGEIAQFIKFLIGYGIDEKVSTDELYIAHLAVSPSYQRRGFGLRLLEHAELKAKEQGLDALSLMTEIENQAAINLYFKAGFKIMESIYYPESFHYLGSKGSLRMRRNIN